MTVLLSRDNAFEAYIAHIRNVIVFLVLGIRKVALNGRRTGEDKFQAPNESLEEWVRATKSGSNRIEKVVVVKAVSGRSHIAVAVVQVTQCLVLVFNGFNLYGNVDLLQRVLVALQNLRKVAKKNLSKLMRKNMESGIEIRLVVFCLLRKDFRYVMCQSDECNC